MAAQDPGPYRELLVSCRTVYLSMVLRLSSPKMPFFVPCPCNRSLFLHELVGLVL